MKWIPTTPSGFFPNAEQQTASMKKPTEEDRKRMCTRKRRYRTQGDALDAAMLAGCERRREAYLCPICRHWHLTSN